MLPELRLLKPAAESRGKVIVDSSAVPTVGVHTAHVALQRICDGLRLWCKGSLIAGASQTCSMCVCVCIRSKKSKTYTHLHTHTDTHRHTHTNTHTHIHTHSHTHTQNKQAKYRCRRQLSTRPKCSLIAMRSAGRSGWTGTTPHLQHTPHQPRVHTRRRRPWSHPAGTCSRGRTTHTLQWHRSCPRCHAPRCSLAVAPPLRHPAAAAQSRQTPMLMSAALSRARCR